MKNITNESVSFLAKLCLDNKLTIIGSNYELIKGYLGIQSHDVVYEEAKQILGKRKKNQFGENISMVIEILDILDDENEFQAVY